MQHNATIAWNLLQTLAKRLRTAQDEQPRNRARYTHAADREMIQQ